MPLTFKRSPGRKLSDIVPGPGGTTTDDLVKIELENAQAVFVYLAMLPKREMVWPLHPDFLAWSVLGYLRRNRPRGAFAFLADAEVGKPLAIHMERSPSVRVSVVNTKSTVSSLTICRSRDAYHDDLTLHELRP